MKKFAPFYFIGIFLILFACHTDDASPELIQMPGERNIRYVSVNDIPDIMKKLETTIKPELRQGLSANHASSAIGSINMSQIMEVLDTVQNTNYTFLINDNDSNPFTFTNLVVKRREDGSVDEPYLLEYQLDSAFRDQFIASGFAMDQFTGTIVKSYLRDFGTNTYSANLENRSEITPRDSECREETSYVGGTGGTSGGVVDDPYPSGGSTGGSTLFCYQYMEAVQVSQDCKPYTSNTTGGQAPDLDNGCDANDFYSELYGWNNSSSTTQYVLTTRCTWVNTSTVYDDSMCPGSETEDIGILIDPEKEYLDYLASRLPREMFLIDPSKFWEWLWRNGYVDPFGAGIIDGALETLGGIVSLGQFIEAWNPNNPDTPARAEIRERTREFGRLIGDLVESRDIRRQFIDAVKNELSSYIDVLTWQNGSNEALHAYGKAAFNVASLFFGVGEINALLKGGKFSSKLISIIKVMPDDLAPFLVRAQKKFKDSGLPPSVYNNLDNVYQKGILDKYKDNIASATNAQKGNFGEIGADLDLNMKGYESLIQPRINDINAPGHDGIDGVYKKDGKYYIVEGKYSGSSSLNPSNPSTGLARQMSDAWILSDNRLLNALNGDQNLVDDILDTGYSRILAKVSPDGSVSYQYISETGYLTQGGGPIGVWRP